jgi:glutamate-1-semialdehyde 2,1-aminomutase
MAPSFDRSRALMDEARHYLAGGVNSNFRAEIAPTPLVFKRAEGAVLVDADGNRIIDYYLGMGAIILGHTPAKVIAALQDVLGQGFLYAGQTELEIEAGKLVCELVPCAERVRFASSGSEAVQAALRVARAATSRLPIVKFEGHYHGWFDNVLWSTAPALDQAGPAEAPQRVAGSRGQDPLAGEHVDILPWNNLAVVSERLQRGDVAAVIMEPAMCNASAILPENGYLEGVRRICNETGTLLIFDEVITGFRVATGGAQQRLGVTPDLATFGKAIANGFPVACLAGRADLLDLTMSGVLHGGTYNGQNLSMAATIATLRELRDGTVHRRLEAHGQRLMEAISGVLEEASIPYRIQGFPQIFHVALGVSTPIRNYRDAQAADRKLYIDFTTALLDDGVRALERGAWFMSDAHDDSVIDQTLQAVERAVKRL